MKAFSVSENKYFARRILNIIFVVFFVVLFTGGCGSDGTDVLNRRSWQDTSDNITAIKSASEFESEPYIEIDDGIPDFGKDEKTEEAFEKYSDLDELGRCGVAYANICREIMPTKKRDSIASVKPSGWQSVKYDCVDGGSLYNRCHLIGFQLAGENANRKNLITGTRYFNVEGMLPFEDMVAEYVKRTGNHVLYRVTPVYEGDNLVAEGVQMEGYSVEDKGQGICFNVFVYNVQPEVVIDYATGESRLADDESVTSDKTVKKGSLKGTSKDNISAEANQKYIINTNTGKFHYPSCKSVGDISDENKKEYTGARQELIDRGNKPCGRCKP